MAERTDGCVALFIDWDNLAISTAADLGGAVPDVRKIVRKAQEYGSIVVARAYAEWNTMSERLSVYRAGVEPVYAPTFRFEPDPVTQAARGKSLADPVMVADCVDSLHILPQVNVYVIVTGDKDLIPVVRLAQLRGRKVVVIGPDYVAAVLKDMADEFVSYRAMVAGPGVEAAVPPAPRGREVVGHPPRRQPRVAEAGRAQVAKAPPTVPTRPAPPPAVEEREAEPAPEVPDISVVFGALVEILRHMATTGRERVRATNLKDQLLVRLPGFSERKYGYSKFKDLLLAAEKSGILAVTAAGPVHWVSLPPAERVEAEPAESQVLEAEPAVTEAPEAEVEQALRSRDRRLAVVRFIDELRSRSRWLTYTYVLTNVIGFIGRLVPPAEAENEARSVLNFLVSEGVLRIDKVPQEVDVGGIKHRVRMCHFVEEHELAREARLSVAADLAPALAEELERSERPQRVREVAVASAEPEAVDRRASPAGEPSLELSEAEGKAEAEPVEAAAGEPPAEEAPAKVEEARSGRSRRGRRRGKAAAEEAAPAKEAIGEAPPEQEVPSPTPEPTEAAAEPARPSLPEVFASVREALGEFASQGKARVTGSSLKLRLSRAHEGFDERHYGFSKFKDFLVAAEKAGCAAIETEGVVSWVRAPRPRLPAGDLAEAQPARTEPPTAEEPATGEGAAAGEEPAAPSAREAEADRPVDAGGKDEPGLVAPNGEVKELPSPEDDSGGQEPTAAARDRGEWR